MKLVVMGVVLLCAAPMAQALQPCRPEPPVRPVWPHTGGTIPRNGVVYLRITVPHKALRALSLRRAGSRRALPSRLTKTPHGSLWILAPRRPLPRGSYEVWARVSGWSKRGGYQARRAAFTTHDLKVVAFRVTRRRAATAAPRLGPPRVRLSAYGDSNTRRRFRSAGRSGSLEFPKQAPPPVVVALAGAYLQRGRAVRTWTAAYTLYGHTIFFANIRLTCGWGPAKPPAPRAGRYRFTLTPWSATGRSGKPRTVSGRIRTRP